MTDDRTAWVTVPICGSISLEITVPDGIDENDTDELFALALETLYEIDDPMRSPKCDAEYEYLKHVTQGNIFYGSVNNFSAELD